MDIQFYVYILASKKKGRSISASPTTCSSHGRAQGQACSGLHPTIGSTSWSISRHLTPFLEALARERALKRWRRASKIQLIEKLNADWRDLSGELNA
jgi:putative endonuclease